MKCEKYQRNSFTFRAYRWNPKKQLPYQNSDKLVNNVVLGQ